MTETSSTFVWCGVTEVREDLAKKKSGGLQWLSDASCMSQYCDASDRQWCLLSKLYDAKSWGGLVEPPGSIPIAAGRPQESSNVKLDTRHLQSPYTHNLYENACHVRGSGATWRLNTGPGNFLVRLHLLDWWKGGDRRFRFKISGDGSSQQDHIVCTPENGQARIDDFTIRMEGAPWSVLEVSVFRDDDLPGDTFPCFSAFEVLALQPDTLPGALFPSFGEALTPIMDKITQLLGYAEAVVPEPTKETLTSASKATADTLASGETGATKQSLSNPVRASSRRGAPEDTISRKSSKNSSAACRLSSTPVSSRSTPSKGAVQSARASSTTRLGKTPSAKSQIQRTPALFPSLNHQLPNTGMYVPKKGSILVVAAGAPWLWDSSISGIPDRASAPPARHCADCLAEAGYDVTSIYKRDYDKNPPGINQFLKGEIDLSANDGKNNFTVADDLVIPKLQELVAQGRGPEIIITGSRGGLFTLPRLWQLGWRGAAICTNAGCVYAGKVPQGCRLTLVTGGREGHKVFAHSADPSLIPSKLKRLDLKQPVLVYHDPKMGHTGAPDDYQDHGHHMLSQATLERLVQITLSGEDPALHADGWPSGAYLKKI